MQKARSQTLDIIRAVAVFLVLGRHLDPCPEAVSPIVHAITAQWHSCGWMGVDMFFVLSGFLVSGLLFAEHKKTGGIEFKRFFARRGLKIWPSFWLMILASIAIHAAIHHRYFAPERIASELGFVQNYAFPMWGHTWSLAVEEHFYILLPLLLAFLCSRTKATSAFQKIPLLFCCVAVFCLVARILTYALNGQYTVALYFQTHLRIDALFFGVFLSYLHHYHAERFVFWQQQRRALLLVLGTLLLLPALILPLEHVWTSTVGFTLNYLGFGALLVAVTGMRLADNSFSKTIGYIGARSYAIYLWHVPMFGWFAGFCTGFLHVDLLQCWPVCAALFIAGTVLAGVCLSNLIDMPVLKLREILFPSPRNVSSLNTQTLALIPASELESVGQPPLLVASK